MYDISLLQKIDFSINNDSSRYYYNGISVPRVTDIISSTIHSDRLMYWANNIGRKGLIYKDELERAANIGTQAHQCIELYLKDKIKTENNIPFCGYLLWENTLNKAGIIINPLLIEHKMSCQWFGGTLDALFDISGRKFLIDFKTSNHVTFNYFLQLGAYLYLLSLENIFPDGVIVLQLDKKSPGFMEYLLDFSNINHKLFIKSDIGKYFNTNLSKLTFNNQILFFIYLLYY